MDVHEISAKFPFHKAFLTRVENFVKETTSTSPDTIEEFDQTVNNNIQMKEKTHALHDIQHVCIDNLRTMLYLEKARMLNHSQHSDAYYNSAKNLNDEVLKSFPDNFNALYNKLMLPDTNGSVARESADAGDHDHIIVYKRPTVMDELKKVSEDDKLMLIAKAEVAGMYTYLEMDSESSLRNSVCLYEGVLGKIYRSTVSYDIHSLDRLIVFWKQDLLWIYKLLSSTAMHNDALSRAKNLTEDLDQSPIVDERQKAKAWANLAFVYEHHMPTYQQRWPTENTTEGRQKMRECFAKAMELDPNNARIHMQAARELRKRDRRKPSLLRAIELFKISLNGEDVEDIRGFILFHMGLTFRQLWIDTDHPRYDVTVNAELRSEILSRHLHHPHFEAPVIKPPELPWIFAGVPPPLKNANRSVDWRFLNPIARDRNNEYLREARRCLQEASETDEEERCQFLIELSRIYISTGAIKAARKCFQRAHRDPCSDMVSVEFVGVSLHENMGFLEESEMMRGATFNDADAEKIKSLYRESIRQSTQSGWKPVVAFHCLLALHVLYKQLETRSAEHLPEDDQTEQYTDHMIIQNEYFLLYMAIQEANDSRDIVNSLATDNFKLALMWKLIEMFTRRNREYDAAAAFTYLSILVVSGLITEEVAGISFTAVEKQRMLLEAAEKVARQRVRLADTRYLLPQYRELCDLCDAHQEPGAPQNAWSDYENEKLNIVMKIIKPDFPRHFYCRKEKV